MRHSTMKESKPLRFQKETRKMMAIMKMKNRALAVYQKAKNKFIIQTTTKNKEVEINFRSNPQMCASFIFNHNSKRYFLYCKGKGDKASLELKTENASEASETNLFKVTMDSDRYQFQPYLNDGWFLSVSKQKLILINNNKSDETLFVLEECEQNSPEGNVRTSSCSSCSRVSQQQRK